VPCYSNLWCHSRLSVTSSRPSGESGNLAKIDKTWLPNPSRGGQTQVGNDTKSIVISTEARQPEAGPPLAEKEKSLYRVHL